MVDFGYALGRLIGWGIHEGGTLVEVLGGLLTEEGGALWVGMWDNEAFGCCICIKSVLIYLVLLLADHIVVNLLTSHQTGLLRRSRKKLAW